MRKQLLNLFLFAVVYSNYGQWQQTNGPFAGNLQEIIEVENTLFLSSFSGGIFKSVDDGVSWTSANSGLPVDQSTSAVDIITDTQGNLYCSFTNNGIFRSEDLGETWVPASTGIGNTVWHLYYDNGTLYGSGDQGGIYVSENNGESWDFRPDDLEVILGTFRFQQFLTFDGKLYAFKNKLFESLDKGVTWTEVELPFLGPNGVDGMIVEDNVFYLATNGSIYTSSDNLVSWEERIDLNLGTDVRFRIYNDFVHFNRSAGGWFYRTEDNGVNWIEIENDNFRTSIIDFFVKGDLALMTTVDSQLWRSIDGGISWSVSTEGIAASSPSSIIEKDGEVLVGVPNAGIFKSVDLGDNWVLKSEDLTTFNSWVVNDFIEIEDSLAIATGGGLYFSTDNGENWELKLFPGTNEFFYRIGYDQGNLVACGSTSEFYISSDLGETWTQKKILPEEEFKSVFGTAIQGNYAFVGTFDGKLYRSDDLGDTWSELTLPNQIFSIRDIVTQGENLLVTTSTGAYFSTDLGDTWAEFENNNLNFLSIAVKDDLIYAGTLTGLYGTTFERLSWTSFQEGLPTQIITSVGIGEDFIYAGTGGIGIWKQSLENVFIPPLDDDEDGIPNSEDLCPNTQSGVPVSRQGCDFIESESIKVLALTPSCVGSTDGSIEISMDEPDYSLNILLEGASDPISFENISSTTPYRIRDLPVGSYTVRISIPEILLERTFGVTINELGAITGRRVAIENTKVIYKVSGSRSYIVNVNDEAYEYNFADTGEQLITVSGNPGKNEIGIKGSSDCQGMIEDTINFKDVPQLYPTLIIDHIIVEPQKEMYAIKVFNVSGRLVQQVENETAFDTAYRVDMNVLDSGIYFVVLSSSTINQSIKVLKK